MGGPYVANLALPVHARYVFIRDYAKPVLHPMSHADPNQCSRNGIRCLVLKAEAAGQSGAGPLASATTVLGGRH